MKRTKINDFLLRQFEQPFRKLTIADRAWAEKLCWADGNLASHINFPTQYILQSIYPADLFRKFRGCLIKKPWIEGDTLYLTYPIGDPKKRVQAFRSLVKMYASHCQTIECWAVSKDNVAEIQSLFGETAVHVETSPNNDNYILDVQEQINLEGPQYHNRRKKIARFNRAHNWTYEPITKENLDSCLEINDQWFVDHDDDEDAKREQQMLHIALNELDELKLQGGLFRIDGKPAAFYIGTPFNKEVYLSMFMKADNSYPDIYLVFTHEFFKLNCRNFRYDNEDADVGLEGLRKYKTNLHPVFKVPMYDVTITLPTR